MRWNGCAESWKVRRLPRPVPPRRATARRKSPGCRVDRGEFQKPVTVPTNLGVRKAAPSTILHRPGPCCDRNCNSRQGRGRSTPVPRGTPLRRMLRAAPSIMGVSSISAQRGGNELVTMPRPPAFGAWPDRAELPQGQARDPAPMVIKTVAAMVTPILHSRTDPPGGTDSARCRRRSRAGRIRSRQNARSCRRISGSDRPNHWKSRCCRSTGA